MRKLFILALCATVCACAGKKEKNEEPVVPQPTVPVKAPDSGDAGGQAEPVKTSLTLDGVEYPGNVAHAVFQENGKTLFYYNVDTKKGAVSINGQQYSFDHFSHVINEPDFTLKSGNAVTIKVEQTVYGEYENPEPGIMKGKAGLVTVIRGTDTLTLKNRVEVIDGTNAD